DPVPPRQLNPAVPHDLETVCLKCLGKEPSGRYASGLELAADLQAFQEGRPIRARPMGRLERTWRWCRRNRAVAGLLGVVALLLLGGASIALSLAVLAEGRATELEESLDKEVAARKEAADERARAVRLAEERARAIQELEKEQKRVQAELAKAKFV